MQQMTFTTSYACPVSIEGDETARKQSLLIRECSAEVAATLPPDFNPVTACERTDPATFRLTLKYPHGLFVTTDTAHLLAPRRVPVFCAPSAFSLDDILSSAEGSVKYVNDRVILLSTALAGLETFLAAGTGALCTHVGINGDTLVSSLADRLPRTHKLTRSDFDVQLRSNQPCSVSGAMSSHLRLLGQSSRVLHVGHVPSRVAVIDNKEADYKDSLPEALEIICQRTDDAISGYYLAEPGGIDFELPGEIVTVLLPRGWYTLTTTQAILSQALDPYNLQVQVSSSGLEFAAAYVFGVRFDSLTGLHPSHVGFLSLPLRGLTAYTPSKACPQGLLPLFAQSGPRLRMLPLGNHVLVQPTLAPPVEAKCFTESNQVSVVRLELDEVGEWATGCVLEIGHKGSLETTIAIVLPGSNPLVVQVRCVRPSKLPERVLVRSVSWTNNVTAFAEWLLPCYFEATLNEAIHVVPQLSSINVVS